MVRVERPELVRFLKFVVAGGVSVVVNLGARVFINGFMSYRWSVAIAYLFGMATAFALFKFMVFPASGRTASQELLGFTLVNSIGAAQVWVVSVGLAEYFFPSVAFAWHPEFVAHCLGLGTLVITSYVGHKHLSFRPRELPVR